MDLSDGQLQEQRAGGKSNASADPLGDSPLVDIPEVPQPLVDLSPFVPETRIYDHASIQASVGAFAFFSSLPPPLPRSSAIESTFQSPSSEDTHIYQYPPAKFSEDSSSDDSDDLPPPPPRDSLNRVVSKIPSFDSARTSPQPHTKVSEDPLSDDDDLPPRRPQETKAVIKHPPPLWSPPVSSVENRPDQRQNSFWLEIRNLIEANQPKTEQKLVKWWTVPPKMYWPWKQNEAEAQQLFDIARSNLSWVTNEERALFSRQREDGRYIFSVYDSGLLNDLVDATEKTINPSTEGSVAAGVTNNDIKVWSIGCDFAIFSQSSRVKLQNTPIVPYELFGTCDAARRFINSENLMRGLAHLELQSIFELPDIMEGSELSRLAYAFFRGREIPTNIDHLSASPLAIPTEYRIYSDGRSDRAKVIACKPSKDRVLATFLHDVMISNYLEQVLAGDKQTMSGSMPVQRHSTFSGAKTKLNARERSIGTRTLTQTSAAQNVREQKRNRAWWVAHGSGPAPGFDPRSCVPKLIRLIAAGQAGGASSQNDQGGDDSVQVTDMDTNELSGNNDGADVNVGEASGTNGQTADFDNSPEQTANATSSKKKNKAKGKSKKGPAVAGARAETSPSEESSSILPQSVSDNAPTNSSQQEITAEAASILIPGFKEFMKLHGAELAEAASTVDPLASVEPPTSSSSVPVTTEGKSKKDKKNKKDGSIANVSSNPTASVSASRDESVGKIVDVQPIKALESKDQSAKKVAESPLPQKATPEAPRGETKITPISVLEVDNLGISMPADAEDDTWETVKSRSAQKAKVAVPSIGRATRGNLKGQATVSRGGAKQIYVQQGPRIVTSLLSGGLSKVVAKELRVSDPNEFPAMPTSSNGKNKTQSKDTVSDAKLITSQNSPISDFTASANQTTPIASDFNVKGTNTTIPDPDSSDATTMNDIDFGGDLYGASPPRKAPITANIEDNPTPAAPAEVVSSVAKVKIAIPAMGGTNDTKGKGKAPIDVKHGSGASAAGSPPIKSNGKGKTSKAKSNVLASGSTSSGSKKKKNGKGSYSASERAIQAVTSPVKSDIGQAGASTSVAPSSTEPQGINKKTVHKHVGKKGSVSELKSEPKKAMALDEAVISSSEVSAKEQSIVTDSDPAEDSPSPHALPALISVMQNVDKNNVNKLELTSVPHDLAWADLLSGTKPGFLKRRLSAGNRKPDNYNYESTPASPVRRNSISADTRLADVLFGPSTPVISNSSFIDDDPFVGEASGAKGTDVSFTSTSSDVELRDSHASPETHVTPRTDLMLTPVAPNSYNGEAYTNVHGHQVTMYRKSAETSSVPGQQYHQRASSGPARGNHYGNQASSSRPTPQAHHNGGYRVRGDFSYGLQANSAYNSGQGAHSHPQPTYYGAPQANTYAPQQDGRTTQGTANSQPLGGDLMSTGPDMLGSVFLGLAPVPDSSIESKVYTEEVEDHNPPTKCTFCEEFKVPTAADPFHLCPLCGVVPGTPRYCSHACLLANAWEHNSVCLNAPAYQTMSNTNLGPTYRWEHLPLNNCNHMPDSPEKYRQKIFAMFCKYGEVPDIRYANSRKWPYIDWSRLMPSCARTKVGDYHIFKSSATTGRRNDNPSKAIVICTIKYPLNDGGGMKLMTTRALNVALVTHDPSVVHFLCRLLRYALIQSFPTFGAIEPREVVMTEFKTQFFKEFGLTFNDSEQLINPAAGFASVEHIISYYELGHGGLQYWVNAVFNRV